MSIQSLLNEELDELVKNNYLHKGLKFEQVANELQISIADVKKSVYRIAKQDSEKHLKEIERPFSIGMGLVFILLILGMFLFIIFAL